ncbi:MAG: SCP2 sterol-binding domain-containing protein [Gammaproteobacteria bacterium]|nr:SCP2 sterol-binding domain-containing protein [Gammaproteobacteria bacterium]
MKLPNFPKPLARFVSTLPSWPASRAFVAAGNLVAWPSLRDLDWSHVAGRRFRVQVSDLGLKLYFSVTAKGFRALHNGLADVTFTATAQDFARLALRLEDPDTLFFNRRLLIEGDTDLGLMVKNMLDAVELETAAAGMPGGMGRVVMKLRQLALR